MSKSSICRLFFSLNSDAISCKAFCRIGFFMLRKREPKRNISTCHFTIWLHTSMHQLVCTCDRKTNVLRSLPGENVRIGRCSSGITHGRTVPYVTQTAEVCLFSLTNWPSICQKLTCIPFGHKEWMVSNHRKAAANVEKQAGRKNKYYNHEQKVPCAEKVKGWIHFKCSRHSMLVLSRDALSMSCVAFIY